ncbi:hypothetical protein G7046_g4650 [Stylonectria norvegica]|nr:hypothetical protein G7046_g4650 [Stylonectria norvegica]
MSGFQIPGLGQAKPNETLPPLPSDVLAAAASVEGIEMVDAPPATTQEQSNEAPTVIDTAPAEPQPIQNTESHNEPDAMVVDQPGSPPSLTYALEAALGGFDSTATTTTEQPQAPAQDVELQDDEGTNPQWEVDSSPYESSLESSSSDSSDDDSDNEAYELLGAEETARLLMQAEGGSDDEGEKGGKGSSAAQLRTKNEIAEEIVPKPDVTITPEMKIEELGAVEHIVDSTIVVKAVTPGEYQVLDTGSVICTADRVVIGAVSETIGKVLQPMYTVRFSSAEEVQQFGLEIGTKVYYPPDHASYVFTEPLKNLKGSDASNLHDEEVADEEMEFSDDEKEAEYKRSLKQKKKDKRSGPMAA